MLLKFSQFLCYVHQKFFKRILDILGSWPECFGSLSVFRQKMGGVKIKTKTIAFFTQNDRNSNPKNSDYIYDIVMNFVFFMSLAKHKQTCFWAKKKIFSLNKRRSVERNEVKNVGRNGKFEKFKCSCIPQVIIIFVKFDQFTCSNSFRATSWLAQKVIFLMCLEKKNFWKFFRNFLKKIVFSIFCFVGFSLIIWQQDRKNILKCCQTMSIVEICAIYLFKTHLLRRNTVNVKEKLFYKKWTF